MSFRQKYLLGLFAIVTLSKHQFTLCQEVLLSLVWRVEN